MRIAHISWESLHAIAVGGVAVHASHLAEALRRRGGEVHLFTRRGAGQRLRDNVFGVHLHRCPHEPRVSFYEEACGPLAESWIHYAAETVREEGAFDWIHCHDWMTIPAGLRLRRTFGSRLAVTFHSTEWGRAGAWPEAGEAARIRDLEAEGVAEADLVIAVSRAVRRELEALYHPPDWRTATLYHGVDPAPFDRLPFDPGEIKRELALDPMDPTALFVGRLHPDRGADLLPEIAETVRARWPAFRLLVAGEGPLGEHLERERERRGLEQTLRLLGWRQGRELTDLYRTADVVLLPSRRDPYGVAALQAWAARTAVVATAAGAPGEFAWEGAVGLRAEPSASSMAEGVLALFADFDRLRWMGHNGRAAVEEAFTWDRLAGGVLEAYRRAVRLAAKGGSAAGASAQRRSGENDTISEGTP